MKIYLVRHAAAVDPYDVADDGHRYLTADGRRAAREVGKMLRDADVVFDAVLTSPLVRAVQTAELLADAVDFLGTIEAHAGLQPGCYPRQVGDDIPTRGHAVAVIGHEPTISQLGAYLVGQPGFVPFRTCQVCALENRRPMWTLRADFLQFEDLHLPG